jgi:hypothetical protein
MTTGNRRSAPSITAAKEVSANGTPHSPWPAILEKLPDYEPDTLVLSLEFYRESVLRRVVDDHGRVTVSLVDIAEVARGLSAGVLTRNAVGCMRASCAAPIMWRVSPAGRRSNAHRIPVARLRQRAASNAATLAP